MRCPSHPFAPPLSPSGNPSRRHAGRVVFAPALSSLLQVRFPAPFQLVAKFVHAVLHFDDQVGYLRLGHELWCAVLAATRKRPEAPSKACCAAFHELISASSKSCSGYELSTSMAGCGPMAGRCVS